MSKNKQIKKISQNLNWHIIPVLNPDGYAYTWPDLEDKTISRYERTVRRMWRRNRNERMVKNFYGRNETCFGVDLNRNFEANFGGKGSSGYCGDIYRGPEAFSEKESLALREYVEKAKAEEKFSMYLTFHSYGQYILFPYGKDENLTPKNYKELYSLSSRAANAIKAYNNQPYKYGQTTKVLYPAAGGSDDWAYDNGIDLAFTYEMKGNGFTLPKSMIQVACEEAMKGVIVMGEYLIRK